MTAIYAIHALAATPIFATRGFLAAFLVAFFARFGADLPLVENLAAAEMLAGAPGWLTGDITLALLGVLALAEMLGEKQAEARELLGMVDRYGKPLLYGTVMLGFLGDEGRVLIDPTAGQRLAAAGFVGMPVGVGIAVVGGMLVWWLARARNAIRTMLFEGDPEDESGVQKLLSWLEDYGVSVGAFLLVVFPLLAFVLALMAISAVGLLRLWATRRENKRRRDCVVCERRIQPSALICPGCHSEQERPMGLGWLGTTPAVGEVGEVVIDVRRHRLELIRWKRCPSCAEPLPKRDVVQACKVCGGSVFPAAGEAEAYLKHVRAQLPRTLFVCFLMSLVPVIGLIGGVVYYRLSLIPGLKRYLPLGTAMVGQWMVRLACFIVLWFQVLPLVGALSVPLMCLINYLFYRRLFERRVRLAKWPAWKPPTRLLNYSGTPRRR